MSRRRPGAAPRLAAVLATVLGFLAAFVSAAGAQVASRDALGVDAMLLIGEPEGEPISGALLEERTEEVASRMRCPVCQGLSVADSPVASAQAMKDEARDLLSLGYTGEQVIEYFELSYGEFIRLIPKPEGFNLMVWIVPVAALLLGAGLLAWWVRRTPGGAAEAAEAEDPDLETYRRRVREEVAS